MISYMSGNFPGNFFDCKDFIKLYHKLHNCLTTQSTGVIILWYVHPMVSLLLALTLAHHDDANPYGWHMSCERFLQRRVEIQMDPNLDQRSKWNLIGYLKTKVEGQCDGAYTQDASKSRNGAFIP